MVQTPVKWLILLAGLGFLIGECVRSFARNDDPDLLNQQVLQLYQAGKYQEAILIARQLLEICEKVSGPEHPDTATSLNNLATLYESMVDYAKAEPLYQRALAIREKALGPEHPDTATSLNNLAELYRAMVDYAKAEPLYQRALAIREKVLGSEHPDTATSLNSLAMLYRAMGDYTKAEPLYQRIRLANTRLASWTDLVGQFRAAHAAGVSSAIRPTGKSPNPGSTEPR